MDSKAWYESSNFFLIFFSCIIKKLYKKKINYLTPYQLNVECCARDWFFCNVLQCLICLQSEKTFTLKAVSLSGWKKHCQEFRTFSIITESHLLHSTAFESKKIRFLKRKSVIFFSDYYKNWDISHIWKKIIT